MIFDFTLRIIVSITVSFFIFYENFDYRVSFLSLVIFYIFLFFMVSVFLRQTLIYKYLTFFIDALFISIFVYLSSYPEIALFMFPLMFNFINNKGDIVVASLFTVLPVSTAVYISALSEVIFIPLYLAFITAVFGVYYRLRREKGSIDKIKEYAEKLYSENLKLQDEFEKCETYENLLKISNRFLNKKLDINTYLANIYELTTCIGIIFYDFEKKKCVSIGDIECKKDIPKYLLPGFNILENTKINSLLDTPIVIVISVEKQENLTGFILFCYEFLNEKEETLLNTVNSYIKAYNVS